MGGELASMGKEEEGLDAVEGAASPPARPKRTSSAVVRDVACPICLEVMVEPVTTSCGHSFDMTCLHKTMRGGSEGSRCPVCRCSIFGNSTFRVSVLLRDFIRERVPEEFAQRVEQLARDKEEAKQRNTLGLANVEDLEAELSPQDKAVDAVQLLIAAATQRGGSMDMLEGYVSQLSQHHLSDKQTSYNVIRSEPEALEALKALLDMNILDTSVIDAVYKPLAMRLAWWGQRPGMEFTVNAGEYRRAMCDAGLLDYAMQLLRKAIEDETEGLGGCAYMDTLTAYALDMSLSDHCHEALLSGGVCEMTGKLLQRERDDPQEEEEEEDRSDGEEIGGTDSGGGGGGGAGAGAGPGPGAGPPPPAEATSAGVEGGGDGHAGGMFQVRTNRSGFMVFACFNAVAHVEDEDQLPAWMRQVDIATYIRDAMKCNIEGVSFMGFKWSNEEIGVCTYSLCVSERYKKPLGEVGVIELLAAKIASVSLHGESRLQGPTTPAQSYWFVSALRALLSIPENANFLTNPDNGMAAEICAQAIEFLKSAAAGHIQGVLHRTSADAAEIVRIVQGTLARATSAPN